ncbi:MAG: kelch repeat-containing protein [Bacteroidota bacterium]
MKKNYTFLALLFLAGTLWQTNAFSQNGWVKLDPISTTRFAAGSCVIDNDIYVFGGWSTPLNMLAASEKYNTETQETSVLENMSVGLTVPSVDAIDGKIYVAGGYLNNWDTHNLLQVYNPGTGTWVLKKELPENIGHQVTGVINGKLYVAGGSHQRADYNYLISGSFVYDPTADEWDSIAPMNATINSKVRNSGIWQASSCVLGGELYVLGGLRIFTNVLSGIGVYEGTSEKYNPDTDKWTDLAEMPLAIAHHASVVYNDKIYLFGGTTESDYGTLTGMPSNRVFEYDPGADSWQEMEPMPFTNFMFGGHRINNYLYLMGGDDDEVLGGEEESTVWRFNLDSLKVLTTGIEQYKQESNRTFSLQPNHPNPFKGNTTLSYELIEGGTVELVVYDMLGREVETVVNEVQVPGQYTSGWNAEGMEPGIYFCKMKMAGSSQIIKMVKH